MNPSLILSPLSLSPSGRSALARALAIARWHDAEVHVLQVRGRRRRALTPVATPLAEADAGIEPRLTQFIESVNPKGARVSVVELPGDPVSAVSEYAKQTGADLIVVAKHGRRHGAYWRPGAYAADLARQVSSPILAVPETQNSGSQAKAPFIEILCPIDFSSASAAAMNEALVLAQQSGGRITLLHVLEGDPYETVYSGARAMHLVENYDARIEKVSRELRRLVPPDAYNWCEIDATAVSGVPHRSILTTAAEIGADLIVIGLPDRGAVDRVVMGSTTTPVLRRATCAVLVVPANRGEQRSIADDRAPVVSDEAHPGLVVHSAPAGALARMAEAAGA
jgi:nucleotide-binding universal stress UspA family protein